MCEDYYYHESFMLTYKYLDKQCYQDCTSTECTTILKSEVIDHQSIMPILYSLSHVFCVYACHAEQLMIIFVDCKSHK